MTEQNAIHCAGLQKIFGTKVAVRGLNLTVKQGEVFGFLGPNGAGKTTSLKMFLSLVKPTAGRIAIFGLDPAEANARARIGFLPEHFRFHDWLTGREFLEMHGRLYGIPELTLKKRTFELLERVGLSEFSNAMLKTFSKGMLQRIGLAQALLNHPALVFLDEPTSGLDPVGRRLVRDIIAELKTEGVTVFLNSHLLSEVEITCDRVAFIKHGEVLQTLALNGLSTSMVSIAIKTRGITPDILEELHNQYDSVTMEEQTLHLSLLQEEDLPHLNHFLITKGVDIFTVTMEKKSLEDQFIRIIGTDGGL